MEEKPFNLLDSQEHELPKKTKHNRAHPSHPQNIRTAQHFPPRRQREFLPPLLRNSQRACSLIHRNRKTL